MPLYTITDTAAGHAICTDADQYDAADAIRAEFADAPDGVRELAETLAARVEGGGWSEGQAAYLALEIA